MKTTIRLADKTDAKQIAAVHIASWQAIYRGHLPDSFLDNLSLTQREKEWQGYFDAGTIALVIEFENTIIGFASICPTRDQDDDPKRVAEISAIYLLPQFWRKGLGRKLCLTVFNAASEKRFKEITIWVLDSNNSARRFYESLGFVETGDTEIEHIDDESLQSVRYKKSLNKVP